LRKTIIHRAWVCYGIAVASYALLFGVWQVEPVPLEVHAAGVLIAAICMFPIALWCAQGNKGAPMFELICIAYLLQFASSIYLQPNSYVVLSRIIPFTGDETLRTLLLVALGVGSMIVGYYALKRSRRRPVPGYPLAGLPDLPRVDLPLHPQRRPRYIAAALVFGVGMSLLQVVHLTPVAGDATGALTPGLILATPPPIDLA